MTRHYKPMSRATRDARDESKLVRGELDNREPWSLEIKYAGVSIDWTCYPIRGNVRQWRVVDAAGDVVLLDGRREAGKDAILRAAAKAMPAFLGTRRLQ